MEHLFIYLFIWTVANPDTVLGWPVCVREGHHRGGVDMHQDGRNHFGVFAAAIMGASRSVPDTKFRPFHKHDNLKIISAKLPSFPNNCATLKFVIAKSRHVIACSTAVTTDILHWNPTDVLYLWNCLFQELIVPTARAISDSAFTFLLPLKTISLSLFSEILNDSGNQS